MIPQVRGRIISEGLAANTIRFTCLVYWVCPRCLVFARPGFEIVWLRAGHVGSKVGGIYQSVVCAMHTQWTWSFLKGVLGRENLIRWAARRETGRQSCKTEPVFGNKVTGLPASLTGISKASSGRPDRNHPSGGLLAQIGSPGTLANRLW